MYQTASSLLFGVGITTLVTILLGALPQTPESHALVIAWAVVAVSLICGLACFFFADQQRKMRAVHVADVITQMEIIERRYEAADRDGVAPNPVTPR
jgi:undecaprenyl pyrophosphate phosphatase UppP